MHVTSSAINQIQFNFLVVDYFPKTRYHKNRVLKKASNHINHSITPQFCRFLKFCLNRYAQ